MAETGTTPDRSVARILTDGRTLLAHAVWLDDGERELIRAAGATAVTNPVANMKLAVGAAFDLSAAQRFGIPDGLYAEAVAVKQGWFCCWNGANQLHLSTGVIGPDRRYVMAISSLEPDDDAASRNTMTQVVKTMFPGGQI